MRSPTAVKSVADRIRTYSFIDDVRYGEEWVEKLYRLRNIATVAGIALGLTPRLEEQTRAAAERLRYPGGEVGKGGRFRSASGCRRILLARRRAFATPSVRHA